MTDTPTIFVAFGVTGDLMKSKILPALFALHCNNELPERFALLGVSRKNWSNADLRSYIEKILSPTTEFSQLESFLQLCFFVQGDAQEKILYDTLAESFEALESTWGIMANKLLYLSLSPILYKEAFEHLRHARFAQDTQQVRLMIEKPFGSSGKSAEKLTSILQNTFDERAIYRVDHYLAKVALQKIPVLEGAEVSSIHITFFESMGVETRGTFFDAIGSLRDVGQNHVLEILARVIMDHSRTDALELLPVLSASEVAHATVRGQYKGYTAIPGVLLDSKTETYFKISIDLQTERFPQVAVILEGGKQMKNDTKEVCITFTNGRTQTFPIGTKQDHSEYEILIKDCMRGNQTLFVSRKEVTALWRFIDPILEGWKTNSTPLIIYAPQSDSVLEAKA